MYTEKPIITKGVKGHKWIMNLPTWGKMATMTRAAAWFWLLPVRMSLWISISRHTHTNGKHFSNRVCAMRIQTSTHARTEMKTWTNNPHTQEVHYAPQMTLIVLWHLSYHWGGMRTHCGTIYNTTGTQQHEDTYSSMRTHITVRKHICSSSRTHKVGWGGAPAPCLASFFVAPRPDASCIIYKYIVMLVIQIP